MSLQFIFGPSGGGKSYYLYHKIIEEAKKDRTKDFLLIVPEQFTMQTQKELVELSENHSIMNIDVLSFERLAFRVFDELGMYQMRVLEETGKNLILRKLAQKYWEEMKVLGSNLKKMGYIGEIKSLISEFMQYQIAPENIEDWVEDEEYSYAFRSKMRDVLLIYREFLEYLRGGYVTSEEILEECAKVADRSEMLKDCNLIFDGFTGFTPVQIRLLETLFPLTDRIWAAVTMEEGEDPYRVQKMQELFHMSSKMVQALMKLANENGCEMLEPIWVGEGKNHRFLDSPALRHLEENLFRSSWKAYPKEQEEILVQSLLNPREELIYTAACIHRMVREEGYRYRDFAIVSGDAPTYANYIKEIFPTYGIPYFVDEKKTILFHPFIEFLRASLEMLEENFSYESVMRYFRTGLSGLNTEEIDKIENYILAVNIRGYRKWNAEFERCPRGYGEEELAELNGIREHFMRYASLLKGLAKKKMTIREKTELFYEFIDLHGIEQKLHAQKEEFERARDYTTAKEYEQIYRIVMELFDKVVEFLGEECLTVEEYADILDAGFEAAEVGVIPPGYDCVVLGDIERTRLDDIKVLIFTGVNDGIVPKSAADGGIISGLERERLAAREVQLAPTPRERTFIQKFYLYLNLTKPQKKLILTFSRVDVQGKAIRPSYLIAQMRKLYPDIEVGEDYERGFTLATPKSSLPYFLEGLQERGKEEELSEWKTLTRWYMEHETWAAPIMRLVDTAFTTYRAKPLPKGLIHELYGKVLESSVTRLERYAACACAHYLQYGLGLTERQIQEFTPADFGNVFHAAIEDFSRGLRREGLTWNELDLETSERLEMESFSASLEKNKVEETFDTKKGNFLIEQMRKAYHRTIRTLTEQVQRGAFRPEGYEVAFSSADHLEAAQFVLSGEERMNLRGRIDRVDTYTSEDKVYVKIVDYKTGSTNFQLINLYHGLQLQLVVYLNAALEVTKKKHADREVIPAGIFYYHVDDPYVEGRLGMSQEEIAEAMLEQLKLDGIVNSEEAVYRAMDTQMGSSSAVIPVKLKKDGSLSAVSKAFPAETFLNLGNYVQEKIRELGNGMMGGNTAVNPYLQDKKSGCDYCGYRSVCGFDEKIPGYTYRKLEKSVKEEEIFRKIEADLAEREDGE
ncbi:MAG: helicase-exonuclease AddAB subunit AddB [Lachnospiraceae bacterium]|nr:helicase-exonuclease AddAB subunit AddB [Lachnospiraceae bacterium]